MTRYPTVSTVLDCSGHVADSVLNRHAGTSKYASWLNSWVEPRLWCDRNRCCSSVHELSHIWLLGWERMSNVVGALAASWCRYVRYTNYFHRICQGKGKDYDVNRFLVCFSFDCLALQCFYIDKADCLVFASASVEPIEEHTTSHASWRLLKHQNLHLPMISVECGTHISPPICYDFSSLFEQLYSIVARNYLLVIGG